VEGVQSVCNKLKSESIIALDTEFIRETTFFPKIALIQVATQSQVWLIDPTVFGKEDLEPLIEIFKDEKILKVIHASHADQECLYWAYGCLAKPVVDTSVAAALCGIGDNVGLQKLLKDELEVLIPKGRSRVKWLVRPLADELLIYAEEDVLHLVDLGTALKKRCERLGRWEWVLEESQSHKEQFDVSAEVMAMKMGKSAHLDNIGRGVLLELVEWRENRAKTKNIPRAWILDNEVLLSLAKVRPRGAAELKTFRGLNPKEAERSGEEILKAVQRGIEKSKSLPREDPREYHKSPPVETHLINLVQSYVAFLAREHSIANRYLLSASEIEWLLKHPNESIEFWVKQGILSERSAALVGAELHDLLQGKMGLKIFKGRLEIFKLES
jgi:ribonuclease D